MRKFLMLSFFILPLAIVGLSACGDEDDNGGDVIGAGGSGGPGTGGTGGGTGGTGGGTGGTGGGDCVNTSDVCDECVTPEENAYQACSIHTDNCVPFDNAGRVPGYPANIPTVP